MSVDERTRHEIHGRFEELLGPELASAFMSYLPPVGWADVATKRDLDALEHRLEAAMSRQSAELRIEMGREIGGLRSEMRREIGGLRDEMGGLRAETGGEIGSLRSEMGREIGSLRSGMGREIGSLRSEMGREIGSLRSELTDRMDRQFRTTIFALIGSNMTLAGLAFAAARFG